MKKQIVITLFAFVALKGWADFTYLYQTDEEGGGIVLTGIASGSPAGAIEIPDNYDGHTVTAIGKGLFAGNQKITSVVIPGTVKTVGKNAFDACGALKTLTLCEGIESIGSFAFGACAIEMVSLPASVLNIVGGAFPQNPKKKFIVAEDNPRYYVGADGKLLLDRIDKSVVGCVAKPGAVAIPEGIVTVGQSAFEAVTWTKMTFPSSLENIMVGSFAGDDSSSSELDFSGTKLRRVSPAAFGSFLRKVVFPSTLSELCEFAFSGCDGLTEVHFLGRQPEILDMSDSEVAEVVAHLKSYGGEVPAGDCLFMSAVFQRVSPVDYQLKSVSPLDSVTVYVQPEQGWEDVCATGTWHGRPIKKNNIDGTTGLYSYMANEIDGGIILTGISDGNSEPKGELIFPSTYAGQTVTGIGDGFWNLNKITKVVFPSTAKRIWHGGFEDCANIREVVLNEGLEVIDPWSFNDCDKIKEITIPSTVREIGYASFNGESIERISVTGGNQNFYAQNGFLIDRRVQKTITCVSVKNGKGVVAVVPEGVRIIGNSTFRKARCASVEFPSSLTEVETLGLLGPNMTACKMDLSRCLGLTRIGTGAFLMQHRLERVVFPSSLRELGRYAFGGCAALRAVTFGGGVVERSLELTGDMAEYLTKYGKVDIEATSEDDLYLGVGGGFLPNVTTYVPQGVGWDAICATGIWQGRPIRFSEDKDLDDAYGPFMPGEKVSLTVDVLVGYAAKGLPSGLKLDKKTGTISGAPKKPTGEAGVTVTFAKKGAETLTAKFIVADWPQVSVACPGLEGRTFTVGVVGNGSGIPVEIEPLSAVKTVKASKLPSGMKLVNDKQTGAWSITGSPKKAGTYNVVLTVTTVYGNKQSLTIPVKVEALPSWSVGTFVGVIGQVDRDKSGAIAWDSHHCLHSWFDAPVTMTVSSAGEVTMKSMAPSEATFTQESARLVGVSNGWYVVEGVNLAVWPKDQFKLRCRYAIGREELCDGIPVGRVVVEMCEVQQKVGKTWQDAWTDGLLTTCMTDGERPLRQNVWKAKDIPQPPSVNGKTVVMEYDDYIYTLNFGKDGTVLDTLTKDGAVVKKGKPIFSIVEYRGGVWYCELFGSVIIDTVKGGEELVRFDVAIRENGDMTCEWANEIRK